MNGFDSLSLRRLSVTETTVTAKLAVRAANWILRTFAPEYAKFIGGSIEYGMRTAAVDSALGNPTPPDWRQGVPNA